MTVNHLIEVHSQGRPMPSPAEDLLNGLLVASAAGDQHAFAELYRLSAPRLNAVVRRLTGSAVDAKEALQEAYVRIWHRAGNFDPSRGAAIHWMCAIARNKAIDILRNRPLPHVPLEEIHELPKAIGLEPGVSVDVRRCLGQLEPHYAHAIVLAFYSGYSHSELATRLDMPLGTVKSWVRRGLAKLKECLDARAH
jgi:RNA polymerase sigma-70 factor, ECF subfamily